MFLSGKNCVARAKARKLTACVVRCCAFASPTPPGLYVMQGHPRASFSATLLGACWAIPLFLGSPEKTLTLRAEDNAPLSLSWEKNYLTIKGARLPEDGLKVHYLEAYCRDGSTDRNWQETVIPHRMEQVAQPDASQLTLRCTLEDGVTVKHELRASGDDVEFALEVHNPTNTASRAHWAQPCIRVDNFTGKTQDTYIDKCFILLDGKIQRLPTSPWALTARYTPGQVYRPPHVPADDVNPRPVSTIAAQNSLSGVYSADGKTIMATAWEPYQELFQGVGVCMHTDFRLGGLEPGETKHIRGKIYVIPANEADLLARFAQDFPEQAAK